MSESLISFFLMSDVAHKKWAMWANRLFRSPKMSDTLRSLRGNERSWANCSCRSTKMSKWVNRSFFWANHSFPHFWAKNEPFARKTDERIPSPVIFRCVCKGNMVGYAPSPTGTRILKFHKIFFYTVLNCKQSISPLLYILHFLC